MAEDRRKLKPARAFRVGIDIGGTFTDVVVATDTGRLAVQKQLSTPSDYSRAAVEGLLAAVAELGIEVEAEAEVIHATTVATNAILQHVGADCALITTDGFRDVLEIGRLRMPRLYDIFYDKRPVLVPRRHVFEVHERLDSRGIVVKSLDPARLDTVVQQVVESGVDSVAVCLINSFANDVHERMVAEALTAAAPHLEVSVSSDILPHIGEFERTSTTVINAYVQPVVRRYLDSFTNRLRDARFTAPLFIMQCSGGLTTVERARAQPVSIVESGPAAGVLAARAALTGEGRRNLLTFDMGGTSAKASIIEDGDVLRTSEYEVGGAMSATTRLTGGGGYPINIPMVDVAEVGAGGGSIAWIDSGGSLRVGPRSAGADPGPACYGRGGGEPTVTDANVVLGYLNSEAIAGGAIHIDRERAERAVGDHIAEPLGLDTVNAAHGIHLIANSEMMGAIRAVSTQRGRDVRDFSLVAFGGCGPTHAAELARAAAIRTVIVPDSPGLFSAFGLLTTDLEFQRSRMFHTDVNALDIGQLDTVLGTLRDQVTAMAAGESSDGVAMRFEIEADLHYWGQSHALSVRKPYGRLTGKALADLVESFEAEHERTYGHRAEGESIILVAVRVIGGASPAWKPATGDSGRSDVCASGSRRQAYFGEEVGFLGTAVIGRHDLSEDSLPGPLVIEEYDSVTVVPPGCSARRDPAGFIVIAVDAPGASTD